MIGKINCFNVEVNILKLSLKEMPIKGIEIRVAKTTAVPDAD